MGDLSDHARRYWGYEYAVARDTLVPLLASWGKPVPGLRVLDVGCGEGGGLCAFHDAGARCTGFDVDSHRIGVAQLLRAERSVSFVEGNIYDDHHPFSGTLYDVVVLHDVFEHLEHKAEMIRRLKDYLAPGGRIMITFPPYYSAYGAHQQHLAAPFARLPFFHLLPGAIRHIVPRLRNEDPGMVAEVTKICRLKMGIRSFERIARDGGLRIEHMKAYVISPNHVRFGLRPVPAGWIARIPALGEILCTGVIYLLYPA